MIGEAYLVQITVQNLRRFTGYDIRYFAAVEPQRRLAPHVHDAMRGTVSRNPRPFGNRASGMTGERAGCRTAYLPWRKPPKCSAHPSASRAG
jgi:hypothetical protein